MKDLLALRLLMDHPKGLYGSEFVHLSEGKLSRGTIYTLLDRLVDKGLVREIEEPPTTTLRIPRTRHIITGAGQRVVREFAAEHGMKVQHGAFGGVRT